MIHCTAVRLNNYNFNRDCGRGSKQDRLDRRFVYYSLYAWTVPMLIVGFGQVVDNVRSLSKSLIGPGFGLKTCWFFCKFQTIPLDVPVSER